MLTVMYNLTIMLLLHCRLSFNVPFTCKPCPFGTYESLAMELCLTIVVSVGFCYTKYLKYFKYFICYIIMLIFETNVYALLLSIIVCNVVLGSGMMLVVKNVACKNLPFDQATLILNSHDKFPVHML